MWNYNSNRIYIRDTQICITGIVQIIQNENKQNTHSDNKNRKMNKKELGALEEVIDPEGPPKNRISTSTVNSYAYLEAILINE